jgi:hypothetical protein
LKFIGFPNGTDDAKRLSTTDGTKPACHLEFDFDWTNRPFGQIVIKGDIKPLHEPQHGIFEVTQAAQ